MTKINQSKVARKTLGATILFYFFIAFEFFYMASPFGVYFYSAYGPSLDFVHKIPVLSWLTAFFLPHVVIDTTCPLINVHNLVGTVLTGIGVFIFIWGASQVYYRKFTRRGAATGGLYCFVRHPQYGALILTGVGMLFLWPRYLVLVMFVTMFFVYNALARVEEQECLRKFGDTYKKYMENTPRFLPFRLNFLQKLLPSLPQTGKLRYVVLFALYVCTLALALFGATKVHDHAINSLYTYYTPNIAYVSMDKSDKKFMAKLVHVAESDEAVAKRLDELRKTSKLVAYVMPQQWYISEIPMDRPAKTSGHDYPRNYNATRFKIIYTRALLREQALVKDADILRKAYRTLPAFEVWVDLYKNQVVKLLGPGETRYGENAPIPVF